MSFVVNEMSHKNKVAVKFFIGTCDERPIRLAKGFDDELEESKLVSIQEAKKLLVSKNLLAIFEEAPDSVK
jgi:hypothetical protein